MNYTFLEIMAGIVIALYVVGVLRRLYKILRPDWWVKSDHNWYSKATCSLGLHAHGRSDVSSMYNITQCRHCGEDVFFVLVDESERRS